MELNLNQNSISRYENGEREGPVILGQNHIGFADIIVGPRGRHESESKTVLRGVVAPPPTEGIFEVR